MHWLHRLPIPNQSCLSLLPLTVGQAPAGRYRPRHVWHFSKVQLLQPAGQRPAVGLGCRAHKAQPDQLTAKEGTWVGAQAVSAPCKSCIGLLAFPRITAANETDSSCCSSSTAAAAAARQQDKRMVGSHCDDCSGCIARHALPGARIGARLPRGQHLIAVSEAGFECKQCLSIAGIDSRCSPAAGRQLQREQQGGECARHASR